MLNFITIPVGKDTNLSAPQGVLENTFRRDEQLSFGSYGLKIISLTFGPEFSHMPWSQTAKNADDKSVNMTPSRAAETR